MINQNNYQAPSKDNWTGRTTDPARGIQYWHQMIDVVELDEMVTSQYEVALLGYACDAGVKRNQGRVGAADGPFAVRSRLGKVAVHDLVRIADVGDIKCVDDALEESQQALAVAVSRLLRDGIFPIVVGGGHDISYGHFMGIWDKIKGQNKRIGIINFDAHFDLRPMSPNANSGTPFYQILSDHSDHVDYMAIGIQPQANTPELYQIADRFDAKYIHWDRCSMSEVGRVCATISAFSQQCDYLYVTIDMDGFSSAYAPGVSAANPIGMEPRFVMTVLQHIFAAHKVISCDIAELNPRYDIDNRTATLAARLVDYLCNLYVKYLYH